MRCITFLLLWFVTLLQVFTNESQFYKYLQSARQEMKHQYLHLIKTLDEHSFIQNDRAILSEEYVNENSMEGGPDVIRVKVPFLNLTSLHLQRNHRVNINAPVRFHEHGVEVPLEGHHIKHAANYQDPENWAVFIIWTIHSPHNNSENGTTVHSRYFLGSFVYSGKEYLLVPNLDDSSVSSDAAAHVQIPHIVYHKRYVSADVKNKTLYRVRRMANWKGRKLYSNKFTQNMLKVELRLLIDVSVYTYWMRKTNSNIIEATKQIKMYFAYIANGADLVYRRMKQIDIALYLLEYEIFTTSEDSFFTTKNTMNGASWRAKDFTKVPINGHRVIKDAVQWMHADFYRRRSDHLSVMTLLDMPNAVGLSMIGQGCRHAPVSVIEATSQNSWDTLAHEMGHNFGANHDGTNGCEASDKYVMTPNGDVFTPVNIKNGLQFSKCTEREIGSYLHYLDSYGKNCLRKLDCGAHNDPIKHVDVLPGLKYTLDHQCDFKMPGSKFCDTGDDICIALYCDYPKNKGMCVGGGGLRATSGTPCGNQKWCKLGSCVFDKHAPKLRSFKDFKGIVHYDLVYSRQWKSKSKVKSKSENAENRDNDDDEGKNKEKRHGRSRSRKYGRRNERKKTTVNTNSKWDSNGKDFDSYLEYKRLIHKNKSRKYKNSPLKQIMNKVKFDKSNSVDAIDNKNVHHNYELNAPSYKNNGHTDESSSDEANVNKGDKFYEDIVRNFVQSRKMKNMRKEGFDNRDENELEGLKHLTKYGKLWGNYGYAKILSAEFPRKKTNTMINKASKKNFEPLNGRKHAKKTQRFVLKMRNNKNKLGETDKRFDNDAFDFIYKNKDGDKDESDTDSDDIGNEDYYDDDDDDDDDDNDDEK